MPRTPVALRLAWRDLRGGLGGYWIFLLCIALGVAAIVAVGSVSGGLRDGLAREGRTILGGDASFSTVSQPLDAAQRGYLAARGRLSDVVTTRAMARHGEAGATLVDIKAVDELYPTTGAVALEPATPLASALANQDGAFGIVAEDAIAARLGVKPGDRLTIGSTDFVLRAILRSEPDKLAGGIAFAPRVMMSREGLQASGLIQPGSLARWTTRVDLGGAAVVSDDGAGALRGRCQGRLSRGRLGDQDAQQRVARVRPQPRPLHAVPDPGRADRAGGRRRRGGQCGAGRHGSQAPEPGGAESARCAGTRGLRPGARAGAAGHRRSASRRGSWSAPPCPSSARRPLAA